MSSNLALDHAAELHGYSASHGPAPEPGAWDRRRERLIAEAKDAEEQRRVAVRRRLSWRPERGWTVAELAADLGWVANAVSTVLRQLAIANDAHITGDRWFPGALPDPVSPDESEPRAEAGEAGSSVSTSEEPDMSNAGKVRKYLFEIRPRMATTGEVKQATALDNAGVILSQLHASGEIARSGRPGWFKYGSKVAAEAAVAPPKATPEELDAAPTNGVASDELVPSPISPVGGGLPVRDHIVGAEDPSAARVRELERQLAAGPRWDPTAHARLRAFEALLPALGLDQSDGPETASSAIAGLVSRDAASRDLRAKLAIALGAPAGTSDHDLVTRADATSTSHDEGVQILQEVQRELAAIDEVLGLAGEGRTPFEGQRAVEIRGLRSDLKRAQEKHANAVEELDRLDGLLGLTGPVRVFEGDRASAIAALKQARDEAEWHAALKPEGATDDARELRAIDTLLGLDHALPKRTPGDREHAIVTLIEENAKARRQDFDTIALAETLAERIVVADPGPCPPGYADVVVAVEDVGDEVFDATVIGVEEEEDYTDPDVLLIRVRAPLARPVRPILDLRAVTAQAVR